MIINENGENLHEIREQRLPPRLHTSLAALRHSRVREESVAWNSSPHTGSSVRDFRSIPKIIRESGKIFFSEHDRYTALALVRIKHVYANFYVVFKAPVCTRRDCSMTRKREIACPKFLQNTLKRKNIKRYSIICKVVSPFVPTINSRKIDSGKL